MFTEAMLFRAQYQYVLWKWVYESMLGCIQRCPNCGWKLYNNETVCPKCGWDSVNQTW